jgi:predicted transglutaminase-like cysteine proteinase
MLQRVNGEVNSQVGIRSDRQRFGLTDHWALPAILDGRLSGDCEDIVLAKLLALQRAGVPAQALSIALVVTRWGEPHAVLVVSATQGDYVLDNLSSRVSPWRAVDHRWLQRQAGGPGSEWRIVFGPEATTP